MADIKIKVDADTGDAVSGLKKVDDALEDVTTTAKSGSEGFKTFGLSLTDLKSGLDLTGQALGYLQAAYDATVGATLAYAEQVRDLGRVTGAGAEDTSRLIQTADDLKVSYETLQQAAKALAKDGIALTTEELAKASDEYLSIEGAGARAEFATTKFGRAGLELTKILETGGAALRDMAAAQEGGLILTEDQVEAARELEKAQDELGDRFAAVATIIGNTFIPAINSALTAVNNLASNTDTLLNWASKIDPILKQHSKELFDAGKGWDEYAAEMFRAKMVSDQSMKGQAELRAQIRAANGDLNKLMGTWGFYTRETYGAANAEREHAKALAAAQTIYDGQVRMLKENVNGYDDLNERLGTSASKLGELQTQYANAEKAAVASLSSQLTLGMSLKKSSDDYQKSWAAIVKEIDGTEQAINRLNLLSYLTPEQQAEMDGLKANLEKQKSALKELESQHETTTKNMIFNMLSQKLASDGLTKSEVDNLIKVALHWGLLDQKSADTAAALNGIDLSGAHGELTSIDDVLASILGKPSSKSFTVTTRMVTIKETRSQQPIEPEAPIPGEPGWGTGGTGRAQSERMGGAQSERMSTTPVSSATAGNITNNFYISGWAGDGASLAAEVMRQQQLAERKR